MRTACLLKGESSGIDAVVGALGSLVEGKVVLCAVQQSPGKPVGLKPRIDRIAQHHVEASGLVLPQVDRRRALESILVFC